MTRPSVFAGAVRAFAASVAIMAVTKPASPAQNELVAAIRVKQNRLTASRTWSVLRAGLIFPYRLCDVANGLPSALTRDGVAYSRRLIEQRLQIAVCKGIHILVPVFSCVTHISWSPSQSRMSSHFIRITPPSRCPVWSNG
jgi:hypothetical protein